MAATPAEVPFVRHQVAMSKTTSWARSPAHRPGMAAEKRDAEAHFKPPGMESGAASQEGAGPVSALPGLPPGWVDPRAASVACQCACVPARCVTSFMGASTVSQRGWMMYDWADSIFVVASTLFVAPFITDLAKANGESDPRAFYSFVQSASTIASILAYVLLSGLGEFGGTKNTLARIAALTGGVCTTLFFCVVVPEMVWVAAVLFIVARVASRITGLMMDALLSEVSHHDDWVAHNVSAKAVTLGYTGMIAFVILVAPIVVLPTFLGMDSGSDTRQWLEQRIPLGLCGVWWTAFAMVAFAWLDKYPGKPFPPEAGHGSKAQQVCWTTRMGMLEQWSAIKTMLSFPDVGRFLLAWMFLSDASSTATSMAVLVASAIGLSVVQQGVAAIIGLVAAALGMTGFRFLVKVGVLTPFWALQVNICVLAIMLVFVPFLRSAWEVYLLTAVGGVNLTQKGTSWIGPLAIGAVTAALKDNSSSTFVLITVIVIFAEIAIGAPIFCCVNVKRGQELAASHSSDDASTDTENP
ncbi:atg22-2 [Symbiodinium sp. KB8]|nr:atg22-2 [Symbiodinium sp. KB8]